MKYLSLLLLSIAFISCRSTPVEVGEGFDSEVFRSDRNACLNKRLDMKESLTRGKDALIGHSENDMFSTLGRYDLQMLDARNQKVFIYFLEPGPQCDRKPSEAISMAVYFNATKLVKEITFQKGIL
jgi:hypothetical protein